MSIGRTILRFLTVMAATGRTIAEERVEDSSIVALEATLSEAPKPIVLVYTDDSDFKPVGGRELWGGQGETTLVLICAVASAFKLKAEDAEGDEVIFSFPPTDEAMEMGIDALERQIHCAIMDPDNPWGQLWHKVVTSITQVKSQRGSSDQKGSRFAARQILIKLETIHDPVMGAAPEGVWAEILEAVRAHPDADIAALGDRWEALIRGGPELPGWKRIQATLGLPRASMKAIGLDPLETDENDQPFVFQRITVDPLGISTDDPGVEQGDEE